MEFDVDVASFDIKRPLARRIWEYERGRTIVSGPTVSGDVVYFGCCDYNVYALECANGKERWRFKTGGVILNPSPQIHGNMLFITSYDGYLYCIDKENGTLLWKHSVGTKLWGGAGIPQRQGVFRRRV